MYAALGLFAISSYLTNFCERYKTDPLVVLFYQHIVYCSMFGTLLSSVNILSGSSTKRTDTVPFIIAVAFLDYCVPLYTTGSNKFAPVALVLAVKRTSILYASFFGGKIFSDERLAPKTLLAVRLLSVPGLLF